MRSTTVHPLETQEVRPGSGSSGSVTGKVLVASLLVMTATSVSLLALTVVKPLATPWGRNLAADTLTSSYRGLLLTEKESGVERCEKSRVLIRPSETLPGYYSNRWDCSKSKGRVKSGASSNVMASRWRRGLSGSNTTSLKMQSSGSELLETEQKTNKMSRITWPCCETDLSLLQEAPEYVLHNGVVYQVIQFTWLGNGETQFQSLAMPLCNMDRCNLATRITNLLVSSAPWEIISQADLLDAFDGNYLMFLQYEWYSHCE